MGDTTPERVVALLWPSPRAASPRRCPAPCAPLPPPAPAKMAAGQSSLFKLFFRCYNEFDAKFDADAAMSSLICFGVSGAGKSTFLARLLSELDPSAFAAALPKSGGKNVTIEGVEIGPGMETTTLVPVMYRAGGHLQIFDAPGFKDPDEQRQIVINILHKCLLTRTKVRAVARHSLAPAI